MATIDLKRFTDHLVSNTDNKYGIVYCTNAARLEAMKHCALNQVVMIPSQVQPKYVMLTLRFFTAQDLPAMDTG